MVALRFLIPSVGVQIPVSLPIRSPPKRAFFGSIVDGPPLATPHMPALREQITGATIRSSQDVEQRS